MLKNFLWGLSATCCGCFSDHTLNMDICSCLCLLWLFTRIHMKCACELNLLDCQNWDVSQTFWVIVGHDWFYIDGCLTIQMCHKCSLHALFVLQCVLFLCWPLVWHFVFVMQNNFFMTFVCADLWTHFLPRRGFSKTVVAGEFETWKFKWHVLVPHSSQGGSEKHKPARQRRTAVKQNIWNWLNNKQSKWIFANRNERDKSFQCQNEERSPKNTKHKNWKIWPGKTKKTRIFGIEKKKKNTWGDVRKFSGTCSRDTSGTSPSRTKSKNLWNLGPKTTLYLDLFAQIWARNQIFECYFKCWCFAFFSGCFCPTQKFA